MTIQADFTSTGYAVQAGDTYADLLAAHQAGTPLASVTLAALQDVSAQVHAGVNQDYSLAMSVILDVTVTGQYEFQVGADWGRGGVAAVIDNGTGQVLQETVRTDDIWWSNNWNHPDVFSTQIQLDAGSSYTLAWVGFEGCCGGVSTVRFSFDGSSFVPIDQTSLAPFAVPEASTALLLGLGLSGLGWLGSRHAPRPR